MSFLLPDFRVRQRDYLLEISRALTQELDLDILLERILKISIDMLAGAAGLMALPVEQGDWKIRVSQGVTGAFSRHIEILLSEIPPEQLTPDTFEGTILKRLLSDSTYTASLGLLTGVGLPLVARQKVVGVVFIFRAYQGVFSANDRSLLLSFANQAAIAIQNAQLYSQVMREKQRMGGLLDAAADGMLILAANHRVERCNQALARMLGTSVSEVQNLYYEDVIRWASSPHGLTLEQAEAGGWPLNARAELYVEGDIKRFDGKETSLPAGVTYAPLLSADGVLLNLIVAVRDITRFRQADELKSTFISIISHELKTPVALIKGYVGTLRREDASWDRDIIQDSLAVIEEEADHLTGLIENLLDASRLQAGGMVLKRSEVWLPELAHQLTERFKTQTNQHTFEVSFPKDFPCIFGDENRLQQVLNNLISNAIKYAPEGKIQVQGLVRPEEVRVCVTDEGPGIDPNDLPFVFDRFYRAPDMARHTKGAGLGLFLSRSIIEAHGGSIWADTQADSGARICFSLPRLGDWEK